jgi:hypothetical protein
LLLPPSISGLLVGFRWLLIYSNDDVALRLVFAFADAAPRKKLLLLWSLDDEHEASGAVRQSRRWPASSCHVSRLVFNVFGLGFLRTLLLGLYLYLLIKKIRFLPQIFRPFSSYLQFSMEITHPTTA